MILGSDERILGRGITNSRSNYDVACQVALSEALINTRFALVARELQESPGRLARTVVLKLKTSDFQILTRSLTPPERPASLAALVEVACALRERVALPSRTRYRLVGVGLSGFVAADSLLGQSDLFALPA